jgi:hypothetical protein
MNEIAEKALNTQPQKRVRVRVKPTERKSQSKNHNYSWCHLQMSHLGSDLEIIWHCNVALQPRTLLCNFSLVKFLVNF